MRIRLVAAMAASLILSGCFHDPQIHGPFLVGAELPGQYETCCRPHDIRLQQSKNGWDRCMDPNVTVECPVSTDAKPASSLSNLPSAPRSAWE